MPTLVSHALAVTAAGAAAGVRGKLLGWAVACSVVPDLDFAGPMLLGVPWEHPLGHRGFTHSIAFALGLAVVVTLAAFRELRPGTPAWWRAIAVLALATASHGVLDALTEAYFGVALLWPFDDTRYLFPWRPIAAAPDLHEFLTTPYGLGVLRDEALWIWLPSLAALALIALRRRTG
jgi:inner membrane protein